MLSQIKSSQFLVNIAHFYACITSTCIGWSRMELNKETSTTSLVVGITCSTALSAGSTSAVFHTKRIV